MNLVALISTRPLEFSKNPFMSPLPAISKTKKYSNIEVILILIKFFYFKLWYKNIFECIVNSDLALILNKTHPKFSFSAYIFL